MTTQVLNFDLDHTMVDLLEQLASSCAGLITGQWLALGLRKLTHCQAKHTHPEHHCKQLVNGLRRA